jgi:hypothetical protein
MVIEVMVMMGGEVAKKDYELGRRAAKTFEQEDSRC